MECKHKMKKMAQNDQIVEGRGQTMPIDGLLGGIWLARSIWE
jgi:hypothetical protein